MLHPATTPAANRDTNSHRSTTLPHLLHSRPRALIAAPVLVHLPAAPRRVATLCTISRLTPTENAITPQNQRRERRNTTSSVNTTERINKKTQEWKGISEEGERNVLVCCSFLSAYGSTSRARNSNYIATTAFEGTTYLITKSRQFCAKSL